MPKEFIPSEFGDNIPDLGLRIGWSREAGMVQIATVASDQIPLEPTPEGNGWFVSLDRRGINDAIRFLRRARDAAFGRDE